MIKPFPRDVTRTSHLERSFIVQRRGMAILAAMFPVAFLASSFLLDRTVFQTSISAYYWTLDPERNIFVGVLCAVAVFLLLYKGYNWIEDRILDAAGVSAAVVAFFPMDKSGVECGVNGFFSVHGVFAVLFFACVFYVCIFMSEHTLKEVSDPQRQARFRRAYRWCSGVMIAGVALALLSRILPKELEHTLCEYSATFWFEAVGIWAFSTFWYVKTRELDPSLSWVPFRKKRET